MEEFISVTKYIFEFYTPVFVVASICSWACVEMMDARKKRKQRHKKQMKDFHDGFIKEQDEMKKLKLELDTADNMKKLQKKIDEPMNMIKLVYWMHQDRIRKGKKGYWLFTDGGYTYDGKQG